MMHAVKDGAGMAMDECEFQFSNRRWNCSTIQRGTVFGGVLGQGEIADFTAALLWWEVCTPTTHK